jgi:hypothetical protein
MCFVAVTKYLAPAYLAGEEVGVGIRVRVLVKVEVEIGVIVVYIGPTGRRTNGPSDQRAVGPTGRRTNGPSDQRAIMLNVKESFFVYVRIGLVIIKSLVCVTMHVANKYHW